MGLLARYAGISLLGISAVFFVIYVQAQRGYEEAIERYSQPGYEGCLGCANVVVFLEGNANQAFGITVLLALAGGSLLTIPSVVRLVAARAR